VARDRQRAKARRAKRQPGAGGPAAGSASTRARDIGLDEATAMRGEAGGERSETGGLGNTPPPEPTKHAMPDVEQAHLAATTADAEDADLAPGVYEDELHDDDEVEGDLVPAGRSDRAREAHPRKRRGRLLTFLRHCVDELRRVQWPDRRQVGQGTAVVLGFVVIAGSYLGLLDAIWKPLINAIL